MHSIGSLMHQATASFSTLHEKCEGLVHVVNRQLRSEVEEKRKKLRELNQGLPIYSQTLGPDGSGV